METLSTLCTNGWRQTREFDQSVLANHDFLDELTSAKFYRLRHVKSGNNLAACTQPMVTFQMQLSLITPVTIAGGDAGQGGTRAPKIWEKYFSGNYYVKFAHFSGKNRVKFRNFVSFSDKYHKNSVILLIFQARIM